VIEAFLLGAFFCGHRLDDQGFKDLIEQTGHIKTVKHALYWHDWERWSSRQETRMKLEGDLWGRLPIKALSGRSGRISGWGFMCMWERE